VTNTPQTDLGETPSSPRTSRSAFWKSRQKSRASSRIMFPRSVPTWNERGSSPSCIPLRSASNSQGKASTW
jgi:hypothetical protein